MLDLYTQYKTIFIFLLVIFMFPIIVHSQVVVTLNKTDVLADTYVYEYIPNSAFGSEDSFYVNNQPLYRRQAYIMWNITNISENTFNIIYNAELMLYTESVDGNDDVYIYHLNNNFNFDELTTTWNNGRAISTDYNNTEEDWKQVTTEGLYYYFNVTNAVQRCVNNGYDNCSFLVFDNSSYGIEFRSRDFTSPSIFLNITYITLESPNIDYFYWVNGTNHSGNIGYNFSLSSNSELSHYVYGNNMSGVWQNSSAITISGYNYNGSFVFNISNMSLNKNVCFQLYVNNSYNYNTSSEYHCINFANSQPTISSAIITPDPAIDANDLVCNPYGASDLDSDSLTYIYEWYKDTIAQGINNQTLLSGNTTTDDDWYCSIRVFDGFQNSSNVLSQTVTIGSSFVAPSVTWCNATTGITNINSTFTKPTNNNTYVNLSVQITDSNDEKWTVFFCKSNQFSAGTCTDGNWCTTDRNSTNKYPSCSVSLATLNGGYYYYAYAIDNSSYVSSAKEGTFVVNILPTIPSFYSDSGLMNLISGTYFYNLPNLSIYFYSYDKNWDSFYTYTDGRAYLNFTLYNSTDGTIFEENAQVNYNQAVNMTDMPESNQTIKGFAKDSFQYSTLNSSEHKIVFDYTNPLMTLNTPSGTLSTRSVSITWLASDTYLGNCSYNVSLQNSYSTLYYDNTIVLCSDYSDGITLSVDGDFTLHFCAYDLALNKNCTDRNFSISTSITPTGGGGSSTIINVSEEFIQSVVGYCGDGVCDRERGETSSNCQTDCGIFGDITNVKFAELLLSIVGVGIFILLLTANNRKNKRK